MRHYYTFPEPFELELGGKIQNLTIAYDTYGTLAEGGSNAVWVCHALTANSDVADCGPTRWRRGRFSTRRSVSRCVPT